MATTLYIDLTDTIARGHLTGIQRVSIEYYRTLVELGCDARAVIWNEGEYYYAKPEAVHSALGRNVRKLTLKRKQGWFGLRQAAPVAAVAEIAKDSMVFLPEIFAAGLTEKIRQRYGCKVGAMFYDASVMHHPEWGAPKMVARFPGYLKELSGVDYVVAISNASAKELAGYFKFLDAPTCPKIDVVELGYDAPREGFSNKVGKGAPRLFTLGTLEARKNHLSLFKACEELWREGTKFSLDVVGSLAESGKPAAEAVKVLKKQGYPIVWHGAVNDTHVEKFWAGAWAFVYPSWSEGFGLPVVEALARGVPVVCSTHAALAERVRHGGCEVVGQPTPEQLKEAISAILHADRREKLAAEAAKLPKRNWSNVVTDFLTKMKSAGYEVAKR